MPCGVGVGGEIVNRGERERGEDGWRDGVTNDGGGAGRQEGEIRELGLLKVRRGFESMGRMN